MKKLSILSIVAIIAISFTACKKDRVCECTSKRSNSTTSSTEKVTIVKSTKRQANANCVSTKTEDNGVTYTEDCELK